MDEIAQIIGEILGHPIDRITPIAGGHTCQVFRIRHGTCHWCFKRLVHAPPDFFHAERDGIQQLAASKTVRVPNVIRHDPSFILMEWLQPASEQVADVERLGRQLAKLHACSAPDFGHSQDNFIGLTPQANTRHSDGYGFFAHSRLLDQGERALQAHLLDVSDYARLETLAANLPRWIPEQPPSLVHGDLWGGNVLFTTTGPALVDPATHYGWGETDLSMTRLFGPMDPRFYSAYMETRPLADGFDDRVPIYNLYHLLNHLNLFGPGWIPAIREVLDRFT